MNDSLGALIAIVVLWSILRFAFGGGNNNTGSGNAAPALNTARSRPVPQHMVDSVKTLFPHISDASIRYDLQRSGSVEATCERILNEGGLPSPPAGFFGTAEPLTPSNAAALRAQNANRSPNGAASASASSVSTPSKSPNLISRYGLQSRIGQEDVLSTPDSRASTSSQGSPSAWATTPEARAKLLQDRKAQMILEARRKLMERQQSAVKEAAEKASTDSAAAAAAATS
jgi:coupling of ubiquitin conjugation to ER degradation protein 1